MTITSTFVPALRRGVRRQFDKARNVPILMAPEKIIVLDDIADAILAECDAASSVDDIIQRLSARFSAPAEEIRNDVMVFLQTLLDQGLIQP
ncbi:MAG TPA: pyrroloquinoline quinone biosynthesis peptide chaperone PqqD [Acidocella sp.]|uniref:pyrroloquinoline quinone biosynthesis peptide chaperone PqqD n=1 Tax=Acidocella sp. TaxID=50710 RepID=UPI002B5D7519|nr:pyrroloquinoline quinone biosynthesis peptide chaperone PqqD [Acidocella sp.]HVE22400.1 pyrroloquinoline quinone biosynthesis peptide chaperone PqqD [Acidocella sp.]